MAVEPLFRLQGGVGAGCVRVQVVLKQVRLRGEGGNRAVSTPLVYGET